MAKHVVIGIGRNGRLIREEVEAESSHQARRIVHAMHPGNEGLACRAPKHSEFVIDALASVLGSGERVAVAA
jgi:hypothetical protein